MKKTIEELEANAVKPQSNELDKKITQGLVGKKENKYVSADKLKNIKERFENEKKEKELQEFYNRKIEGFKYSFLKKFEDCAAEVKKELVGLAVQVVDYRGKTSYIFEIGDINIDVKFKNFDERGEFHYFTIEYSSATSFAEQVILSVEVSEDELVLVDNKKKTVDADEFVEGLFKKLFE